MKCPILRLAFTFMAHFFLIDRLRRRSRQKSYPVKAIALLSPTQCEVTKVVSDSAKLDVLSRVAVRCYLVWYSSLNPYILDGSELKYK